MRASLLLVSAVLSLTHCSEPSPTDDSAASTGSRSTGLTTLSGTPNRLLCNQSGSEAVNIQFNGPRYADAIALHAFDDSLIQPLLAPSERSLTLSDSSFSAFLSVGGCTATPGASDTVLRCDATVRGGTTWVIGRYGFHASRSIGPRGEFSETLGIERDLQVDQLVLSVHKRVARDPVLGRNYTAAFVRLTLAGRSAFSSFSYTTERNAGELVPEADLNPWGRCAFVR